MRARHLRLAKGLGASAVAVMMLAACGGGGADTSSGPADPSGEIDSTAVLRVTTAAPSRNLDPYLQTSYGGLGYLSPIYDRLTMVDKTDTVIPGLAESWEFAQDGSYLELKLREDVTFNDGTVFDAAAVAANIERGKTMEGSTVVKSLEDITGVDVVDATTVRLNLAPGKGVGLPAAFSTHVGMMISPAAIEAGTDIQNDPGTAGSGPYVVTSFVPEETLVLAKADDDYWDPAAGRLAGMEITRMPDASTRLNGVRTGATDLTWVSSANEIVEAQGLAKQGTLNVDEVEYRNVLGVMLRPRGDLAKLETRQGIARAIDPAAISALFSNTCTPFQKMEPESGWAASDASYKYPYAFDEAKAQELAAAAGDPALKLTFSAGTNTEKPANVIQAELDKAGFKVELDPVPNAQSEPRFVAGDFEAYVANSFSPKFDPAETVSTYVTGAYGFGDGDAELADLAAKAADPTMSQDDRAKIYQEIWELTLAKALFIPICHQANATVFTDKVVDGDGVPLVNQGIFDIRTAAMVK